MFREGDRILFPDPLANGEMTEGTFDEIIENDPIEVPAPGGGTREVDSAWVSRHERGVSR
jgi:hypothetical protein